MSDIITLTGRVGTEPKFITTDEGLMMSSFRLVSNHSWFDRKTQAWVEGTASWYSVKAFRQLAENVHHSVHKSDLVIVTGKLRVREWEQGDRKGISVEVDADSIGHDLTRGRSTYTRTSRGDAGVGAGFAADTLAENGWPRGGGSAAHGENVATGPDSRGERQTDYASSLQQPFLPGERSGPNAS